MVIPLINTLILLSSGTTVTWAHHALLENDRKSLIQGLVLTVILGAIFTLFQAYEYMHATFKMSSGIYGAILYSLQVFMVFMFSWDFIFTCMLIQS